MKEDSISLIYGIFTEPAATVYHMSKQEPGSGWLFIVAFISVSIAVSKSLIAGFSPGFFLFSVSWGLAAGFISITVLMFLLASIYHISASLMGHSCQLRRFLKFLPYSFLPLCLSVPVIQLLKGLMGFMMLPFYIITMCGFLVWVEFIQYKMINYFYGMRADRALLVLIVPWLLLFIMCIAVPLLLGTGLILRF